MGTDGIYDGIFFTQKPGLAARLRRRLSACLLFPNCLSFHTQPIPISCTISTFPDIFSYNSK